MKKEDFKEERVIDRLLAFVEWAKKGGMCKSRTEFERKCGLSNNYLYNTQFMTKSSIGVDQLAKIHNAYPMMNMTWVITGKGSMLQMEPDEGYKTAYDELRKKIEKLKKDISEL